VQEPVTGVTWQDAVDYCNWLSQQLGVTVRLPSEAEWEFAAKGTGNFKYPWGNEWKDSAAGCKENGGEKRAVKSYPDGRSPFGAYDMAGSVWEWTGEDDEFKDEEISEIIKGKIIKGGSAVEGKEFVSATSRDILPPEETDMWTGFRYVVVRDGGKAQ
jgi:formylglycine-generating enzyme required for sulfatase activity